MIDTTIIEDHGCYYRISKDETTKNIKVDKGYDLLNGPFTPLVSTVLEEIFNVEGPTIFRFNGSEEWCVSWLTNL